MMMMIRVPMPMYMFPSGIERAPRGRGPNMSSPRQAIPRGGRRSPS